MWHGDWSAGDWIAMSVWMVVFWGLVIAGVVWAIRSGTRHSEPSHRDPQDVARERYARGEIDEETFRRIVRTLDEERRSRTR